MARLPDEVQTLIDCLSEKRTLSDWLVYGDQGRVTLLLQWEPIGAHPNYDQISSNTDISEVRSVSNSSISTYNQKTSNDNANEMNNGSLGTTSKIDSSIKHHLHQGYKLLEQAGIKVDGSRTEKSNVDASISSCSSKTSHSHDRHLGSDEVNSDEDGENNIRSGSICSGTSHKKLGYSHPFSFKSKQKPFKEQIQKMLLGEKNLTPWKKDKQNNYKPKGKKKDNKRGLMMNLKLSSSLPSLIMNKNDKEQFENHSDCKGNNNHSRKWTQPIVSIFRGRFPKPMGPDPFSTSSTHNAPSSPKQRNVPINHSIREKETVCPGDKMPSDHPCSSDVELSTLSDINNEMGDGSSLDSQSPRVKPFIDYRSELEVRKKSPRPRDDPRRGSHILMVSPDDEATLTVMADVHSSFFQEKESGSISHKTPMANRITSEHVQHKSSQSEMINLPKTIESEDKIEKFEDDTESQMHGLKGDLSKSNVENTYKGNEKHILKNKAVVFCVKSSENKIQNQKVNQNTRLETDDQTCKNDQLLEASGWTNCSPHTVEAYLEIKQQNQRPGSEQKYESDNISVDLSPSQPLALTHGRRDTGSHQASSEISDSEGFHEDSLSLSDITVYSDSVEPPVDLLDLSLASDDITHLDSASNIHLSMSGSSGKGHQGQDSQSGFAEIRHLLMDVIRDYQTQNWVKEHLNRDKSDNGSSSASSSISKGKVAKKINSETERKDMKKDVLSSETESGPKQIRKESLRTKELFGNNISNFTRHGSKRNIENTSRNPRKNTVKNISQDQHEFSGPEDILKEDNQGGSVHQPLEYLDKFSCSSDNMDVLCTKLNNFWAGKIGEHVKMNVVLEYTKCNSKHKDSTALHTGEITDYKVIRHEEDVSGKGICTAHSMVKIHFVGQESSYDRWLRPSEIAKSALTKTISET